jgi:hypothetical protein
LLQPINNARTLSGPGFQTLNARFQDLDLRPSVFGSQDQGFRTSKALHPTVVLFFPGHFSLRPPSLFFFPSLFSASTVTFLCVQWSSRSSDRRGEADASTILLLERRGRCWMNIMPVALDRSLSLSRGPLLPPLLPREKNPNASRARSLHSSQRKRPPHALDRSLSLSQSLTPSLAASREKP